MAGFMDDLFGYLANKVANPTQRPGPSGSVIETNESLAPGDAQVNLMKGPNVIETGSNVNPAILTHELGHVQQNEGKSSVRNILEGLSGFIDAGSRGAFVHDPEKGGDRERFAASDGIKRLLESDDPEAKRLLDQLTPEMIEKLGLVPERLGGPASDFLQQLFSNPDIRHEIRRPSASTTTRG